MNEFSAGTITLKPTGIKKRKRKTEFALWWISIPFFLMVILFNYVPLLGWSMAFVKYIPGVSIFNSDFVGFKNFQNIFLYGSEFPRVITNTLALGFLVILTSPFPLILAILISEVTRSKLRRFIQISLALPNFVSYIIVYSVFVTFFSVNDGILNNLMLKLHLISEPTNLLGNEGLTWYFQTFVRLWKDIGWTAIIYIGTISSIDPEMYDAAKVDGANRFQQSLHVTIPGLVPTFTVMLLLSIGSLLSANFEQIYTFHNVLVHDKIETLDYYTYRIGLINYDFSLSTAIGMFKSVINLLLLFSANYIFKLIGGRSIF